MQKEKELPQISGEQLYIPFVGAIIERTDQSGSKQILMQIRDKPSDVANFGCYEIPGGKLKAYEDVFDAVRREIKEECGLDVTHIHGEDERIDCFNKKDVSTIFEPFCVTQMKNGPFLGVIFLCRASGVTQAAPNESKDIEWMNVDLLKHIMLHHPERIYSPFYAPLRKYLDL